jgi:hypothetical protein
MHNIIIIAVKHHIKYAILSSYKDEISKKYATFIKQFY